MGRFYPAPAAKTSGIPSRGERLTPGGRRRLSTVDAIPSPEFDGLISARMAEDESILAMARGLDPEALALPLDFVTTDGQPGG